MKSLGEVFAAHPALRFEYDAAIEKAKSEGYEKSSSETKLRVEAASKILESDAYGKEVKGIAAKVISGSAEISALDTIVAMSDMIAESKKSADAVASTIKNGDVRPMPPAMTGEIKSADDFIERHKMTFGGGKK
jgi:hypothetical protein